MRFLPTILKFGSSVLRSPEDLPQVASEIARHVDAGEHVVAIVSAFDGVTDKLFRTARQSGLAEDSTAFAAAVAQGEITSAMALAEALARKNLRALFQSPEGIGFLAMGTRLSAAPAAIDAAKLRSRSENFEIVIVPGYSAVDEAGDTVLLGRGGSDISAVAIAHAFGQKIVRLVKDVDGVYTSDPHKDSTARRYVELTYQTALERAGVLVQAEAVRFADERGVQIEVVRLGADQGSIIGTMQDRLASVGSAASALRCTPYVC